MGLFLNTLAEHLYAFPNLSEKWRQFHFALASQNSWPTGQLLRIVRQTASLWLAEVQGYPLNQFWKAKDRRTLR